MPQEAGINERAVSFIEGLLRRPGDRRAAALQGQAEPPPARPAAVGAGRARHRDHARRQGRRPARVHLRLPQARPDRARARAPRGRAGRHGGGGRSAGRGRATTVRSIAEPRRPTSRHGLSPDSPLLGHGPQGTEGYDHQTGVLDLPAPPPRGGAGRPARAARARALRRARPRDRRLGPLAAHLRPGRAAARLLLPVLVPRGGRGSRERAVGRRRADRLEPLRRAPAGRADDHAGDPPRAPAAAAAVHARRELVQGLPGRGTAREQDRAGGRAPRERPAAAARRGAARARLPRGPEGQPQAVLAALPAPALRPRRLRPHGDARRRADRARPP